MRRHFLGKEYPGERSFQQKRLLPDWPFLGFAGIGLIMAVAAVVTMPKPVASVSPVASAPVVTKHRVLGQMAGSTGAVSGAGAATDSSGTGSGQSASGGAAGAAVGGSATGQAGTQAGSNASSQTETPQNIVNPCDPVTHPEVYGLKDGKYDPSDTKAFTPNRIFPLVTEKVLSTSDTGCSIPYWNLSIYLVFVYKLLGLLNYAALVMATLFTVYAGLLYLSGPLPNGEGNVKKAKAVLTATYVGLILTLSARYVLGSTQLITGVQDQGAINGTIQQSIGGGK